MASQAANGRGRPLPKFGEWDVNNPASAEGFTVIFNKARDQKKINGTAVGGMPPPQKFDQNMDHKPQQVDHQPKASKKWLCCIYAA
ncbi:protein NOI4-like isoform X2 [Silene latifolia]|uniref:protein NOI4-like isoform X2 n=1 Tax=Silene latifolia TaxID=37657 RepID=UPI003D76ACCF